MTDNHPITVPAGSITGWRTLYRETYQGDLSETEYIATQAARWGADQQLELDAKWLDHNALNEAHLKIAPMGDALKEAMRPKPPSLKEQALEALDRMDQLPTAEDQHILRRALESLPS